MVFYRLLHSYHWSAKKLRYNSPGFEPKEGGISIFCKACTFNRAAFRGEAVSSRIRRLYPHKPASVLTVLWELDSREFSGRGVEFIQSPSKPHGDVCHHDLTKLDSSASRVFLLNTFSNNESPPLLWISRDGQELQQTSIEELSRLLGNRDNPRGTLSRPGDANNL